MTQTKQTDEYLLRMELQLLEQLFIEKFVEGESLLELAPLRRQIMALRKRAAEQGIDLEKESE